MALTAEKVATEYAERVSNDSKNIEKDVALESAEAGFSSDDADAAFDKQETRRILRKVDFRLIPFLSVLYLQSFLDRSNLGNAKIAGMIEDLDMKGMDYNVALTVFFISYALLEVPSNIILKMMKPSQWIAIMMFAWGVVMTLMGIVQSFKGLVVARFFLGVAEAGFFPAASYLLTIWYKRYEVQSRMAVLYTACTFSGAFSGLLAFAIQKMDGIAGLGGWRWIFILEGLLPVITSVFVWYFLPNSPETASFLTQPEKDFLVNRLTTETGSGAGKVTNNDRIQFRHIKDAFSEWRIWAATVIYSGVSIGVYGFTATVPTVVRDLGYTSAHAQLMTIPIYLVALICALCWAIWSDKAKTRTPFIAGGYAFAVIGFIGQLAIPQTRLHGLTYFFLFPIAMGLYSPYVCIVCLIANNLAPSSKRAVGMALLITIGNLGGICGSNIFIASQAPKYPVGFGVCLGVILSSILATGVVRLSYQRDNKKRDEFMEGKTLEEVKAMYSDDELLNLGDKSPFFRYTL